MIIYISAPCANGDIEDNIKKVIDCADELCELGHVPFIPHLAHLWHLLSPKPASSWLWYDLVWLNYCDALLRLPGKSQVADKEVKFAEEHCIPVYYSIREFAYVN